MDHQPLQAVPSELSDLEGNTGTATRATHVVPWRVFTAAAGLLALVATIGVLSSSSSSSVDASDGNLDLLGLSEVEDKKKIDEACKHFPWVRIEKLKSSNLGGDGPDKDAEEGLIFDAEAHWLAENGTRFEKDIEVHIHALTEYSGHHQKEGDDFDPEYKPAWPKDNGIKGHFAGVNLKPGSNVTLHLHAYDPVEKEDMTLPQVAMTFFDLDTGLDNKHSVEYVKVGGFKNYFLTNTTEVNVTDDEDGSDAKVFTATKEGDGDDNPKDPLVLNVLQKNRVVSFVWENTKDIKFELGASPGKKARVFEFVVRPALRCAWTRIDEDTLMANDDPKSPFKIIMYGSATGLSTFMAVAAVVVTFLMQ